jgi:hypothetical protein
MRPTGRALASIAALGMALAGTAAEAAPGVPFLKGGAKRKVTLFVDNMGCAHAVEAKPLRLKKEKSEAVGWRVQNDCNILRRVLFCVYDAQGKLQNPFAACTSVPPGLDIGAPFELTATGGKAELDCPAKSEGNYLALVQVGDEIKAGCPATPPKEKLGAIGERTFSHRLAIEIVP